MLFDAQPQAGGGIGGVWSYCPVLGFWVSPSWNFVLPHRRIRGSR